MVEASAPTFAIVGEPAELSAKLVSQSTAAEFCGRSRRRRAFDDPRRNDDADDRGRERLSVSG